MTAPTHAAFSLVFTGGWFSLAGVSLSHHPAACGAALLGSLLPDLDRRGSALGRLLPWVAAPLEQWRHRTLTHSLLAAAGLALAVLPLAALSPAVYAALLLGLLSHLLLDCTTKSGVALCWPRLDPCVLPRQPRYRFETGGLAERALLVALVVFLVLVVPAAPNGGVWRVVRYLLATQAGAYSDYLETPEQAVLDFRGRWRDSHQEIAAQAMILDADQEAFVVALNNRPVVCGGEGEMVLRQARVRATGRPVHQDTLAVAAAGWDTVLARMPASAWVSGALAADRPLSGCTAGLPPLAAEAPVRCQGNTLHLRFAPRAWLARLPLTAPADPEQRRRLRRRWVDGEVALAALSRQRPRVHCQRLALAETEQAALADSLTRLDQPARFTGVLHLLFLEP